MRLQGQFEMRAIREHHGIASFNVAIQVLHGNTGVSWLGLLGGIEYV